MENKKHCFTHVEKKVFMDILKNYLNVIEDKQTDGATIKRKNEAWKKIAIEYNASPRIHLQASPKQLRRLWMNLKQRTKERKHRLNTNGAESDPDVSQLTPAMLVEAVVDAVVEVDNLVNSVSTIGNMTITEPQPVSPPALFTTQQSSISIPLSSPSPPPSSTNYFPCAATSTDSIMEKEFIEKQRRANELHDLEIQLLKEKIREAKAKADLAEILCRQQEQPTGIPLSEERRN